ncbi:hypothetical protein OEJ37_09480 [Burkholderia sp. BKH01]|uniref:hypothetical protein n=1 Tax=Burkholderia sp. BKH01 TaxID=2769262 RepID=UPI0021DF69F8|nr:hypothetical protein [Burkholderia sp. BKH01]MCU9953587.1 hypothetical protein [Burkholderia sp. BKH01]
MDVRSTGRAVARMNLKRIASGSEAGGGTVPHRLRVLAAVAASVFLFGCDGQSDNPVARSVTALNAAVAIDNGELTAHASSSDSANSAAALATAFNQAVVEARKLNFVADNWTFFSTPQPAGLGWPSASSDARCPSSAQDLQPGYLAGLQNRCAYYSRDYVHQATGAYYLGFYEQNYQMADHFVKLMHDNGGAMAPYWAIGANGTVYEQNDESPAPFEIGENIARMYRLTADSRYLGADFTNYTNNLNNGFTNVGSNSYVNAEGFRMARAQTNGEAATYNEFVYDRGNNLPSNLVILLGGDMAASEIAYYREVSAYPSLLAQGDATNMTTRFGTLSTNFNGDWYLPAVQHFSVGLVGTTSTTYNASNYQSLQYYDYYAQEPNLFPLYKGVITDSGKLANQANYVDTQSEALYQAHGLAYPGIESHTYLPTAFYNANQPDTAWKWLTRLASWESGQGVTGYPEVAFAMISDVITKVLGLEFDAPNKKLVTLARLPSSFQAGNNVAVNNIPLYFHDGGNTITVKAGIAQTMTANGTIETDFTYDSDPVAQPVSGFHWIVKFPSKGSNTQCKVVQTWANGTQSTGYYALTSDSNGVPTCGGSDGSGIWMSTGDPNWSVTKIAVTLSS